MTAELGNSEKYFLEYYDFVEICEESSTAYFKGAIKIRNRYMIKRSDLIIFYVDHNSGGAYDAMRYAIKEKKEINNIALNSKLFV